MRRNVATQIEHAQFLVKQLAGGNHPMTGQKIAQTDIGNDFG